MCIDLKSFYASCECVLAHFEPLDEFLVVADMSRTEKTICLAVSPALKSFGIPGRARLFEVIAKVKEINKTMPPYKEIRGITLTKESLIKTTTGKIKRNENLKKVLKNYEVK